MATCPGRQRVVSPTLRVKEVVRQGRRDILAYNPEAAEQDRQVREAVVARLRQALKERGPGERAFRDRVACMSGREP